MSQHDMNIANQGFPAFRSDLNNALAALVSTSSGATAPATTFANQLWYDTTDDTLKIRDEANAAWISILTLNQTTDTVGQFFGNSSDSATVPSYSWGGDPNTGLYQPAADQIGVTTGGTLRLTINTTAFTATLPWRGQNGTVGAPAYSFSGDTNTGVYLVSADNLAIATGGVQRVLIDSSGRISARGGAYMDIIALTDGATITADFATGNNFSVTLGGNRTLANPTNLTAGQSGIIFITQDGTGSRTLAYGTSWDFPNATAPTLSTTANAVDVLVYTVRSGTSIAAQLLTNIG
jgi:hypothetical protein